jgi:hypothetical protein
VDDTSVNYLAELTDSAVRGNAAIPAQLTPTARGPRYQLRPRASALGLLQLDKLLLRLDKSLLRLDTLGVQIVAGDVRRGRSRVDVRPPQQSQDGGSR